MSSNKVHLKTDADIAEYGKFGISETYHILCGTTGWMNLSVTDNVDDVTCKNCLKRMRPPKRTKNNPLDDMEIL